MVSRSELLDLAGAVTTEFRRKNVTFLAGSIAYNAFVSLVPLVLFVVVAVAVVERAVQDRVLALLTRYASPTIGTFVERIVRQQADGVAGSSVVGLVVFVWGALKLFRGFDTAFAIIYEADGDSSIADRVRDAVVVLASVVLAVGVVLAVTTAFDRVSDAVPLSGVLLPLVLLGGLLVAFFPMYYVFPGADVSPREVIPGVVVAACGWTLLQVLFQVYVAYSAGAGGVSVLTGVMLLVTWLYFCGLVVLLGTVVNATLGGHTRQSVPVNSA